MAHFNKRQIKLLKKIGLFSNYDTLIFRGAEMFIFFINKTADNGNIFLSHKKLEDN